MDSKKKFRKKVLYSVFFVLFSLLCIGVYTYIFKTSSSANDTIVKIEGDSFRNENPTFLVDFLNSGDIKFHTLSSTDKKSSIWEKVRDLFVKREMKGIEISLVEVSYASELEKKVYSGLDKVLDLNFELLALGREIGNNEDEAVSKDTVISRNVYKGVDVEYQIIQGRGLKEEIVLREIPEYTTDCTEGECVLPVNRFLFLIKLDEGLEFRKSIANSNQYPNGYYYITNSNDNYFAHFLPEFAYDSVGNKTSSVLSDISQLSKGEYLYEIVLDPEWLLSEERVFPIRIDPSIVHDSKEFSSMGIYERVSIDNSFTLSLNSEEFKSGTYTSGIIELDSNDTLNSITKQSFSDSTGDGELPFSELGLILEENFNKQKSEKKRWGSGALQLDEQTPSYSLTVPSTGSNAFTLEFWSYRRDVNGKNTVFTSKLGNLEISNGHYLFRDNLGTEYLTDIPVNFNNWQYIGIVFGIDNDNISIFVDEYEFFDKVNYTSSTLDVITFKELGYIDTVRVYERVVAKNELISNSQYSSIYLQYMGSKDKINWSEWSSEDRYIPEYIDSKNELNIQSEQDLSHFNMLHIGYLTDSDQTLTFGKDRFVKGLGDTDTILLEEREGSLEIEGNLDYIDLLFTPLKSENACLLNLEEFEVGLLESGEIVVSDKSKSFVTKDRYIVGERNFFSLSLSEDHTDLYTNGNRDTFSQVFLLAPSGYTVASGCEESTNFGGEVHSVRVSEGKKSVEDILEYHQLPSREYILKSSFQAELQSNSSINSSDDLQFFVNQMPFGYSNYITSLNVGDTVVLLEDGFILEGEVLSIDQDRGFVQVDSWSGEFPQNGFSQSAKVLKYEHEYIPSEYYLYGVKDIYSLDILYSDILLFKNLSFLALWDAPSFSDMDYRYVRYRYIFVTLKHGLSAGLASVNIDISSGGPSMEQLMRHGKWFDNSGIKQSYWWTK